MEDLVNDEASQEPIQFLDSVKENQQCKTGKNVQSTSMQLTSASIFGLDSDEEFAVKGNIKSTSSHERPGLSFPRNKRKLKIFDNDVDINEQSEQNIDAVGPVLGSESVDDDTQHRSDNRRSFSDRQNVKFRTDSIPLPSFKIELLVLSRFQLKHKTENTRITCEPDKGKVTFMTASVDEKNNIVLEMYKCLNEVESEVKTLSEQRYKLLSRPKCLACLQSKSRESGNIRVVYQYVTDRQAIRCFAFTESEASRGIQFLNDAITQLKIPVAATQQDCLNNSTWISLKKRLDVDLTSVCNTENVEIVIESLNEQEATATLNAIRQYLRENTKMKSVSVIVESSKARCFQTRLESKLRHKMQTTGGTFNAVTLTEDPLKIQVSGEGEEFVTDEITKTVDQIWQENIDISDITSQAGDVWLLTKGLDNITGKEFLLRFEQTHTCFIEVSSEKEISDTKEWDTYEEFDQDDEPTFQDDAYDIDRDTSPSYMADRADYSETPEFDFPKKRKSKATKLRQYQAGMNEDEALEIALQLSKQSTNLEESKPSHTETTLFNFPSDVENKSMKEVPEQLSDRLLTHGTRAKTLRTRSRAVHTFKYLDEDNRSVYLNECTNVTKTEQPTRNTHIGPETENQERQDKKPEDSLCEQKSRHLFISKTNVKLIQGHIVQQHAEALVNVINSAEDPFGGTISKSFLEAGGQMLLKMYDMVASTTSGCVQVTSSSGELRCSTVCHVKMNDNIPYKQMISRAVSEIFSECANWNCKSVAIPLLGIDDQCRYPSDGVAETMLTEIGQQLQAGNSNVKQVLLVVNTDASYTVFDEAIQKYKQSTGYMNEKGLPHSGAAASSRKTDKPSFVPVRSHYTHSRPSVRTNKRRSSSSKYKPATKVSHHKSRGNRSPSFMSYKSFTTHDKRSDKEVSYDTSDICDEEPNLKITVTAENKDLCVKARDAFEKGLKDEFLYEEVVEKKWDLTDQARANIETIVSTNEIKCIEEKSYYTLRGHERAVRKACTEIVKVCLEENNRSTVDESANRNRGMKRDTHDLIEYMMDCEPEVPKYWMNYKHGSSIKSLLVSAKHFVTRSNFELVELGHHRHAFSAIVQMINATFDGRLVGKGKDAVGLDDFSYNKLFVLKVERIENLHLYEQFSRKRQTFYRRLYQSGDVRFPKIEDIPKCSGRIATACHVHPALDQDIHSKINEYLLFHGTKEETWAAICNDGFDPRISQEDGMFGTGIYAAESATKADQYADEKDRRSAGKGSIKRMFLIRMVLGNSYVCTKKNPDKFRRPPCTTCLSDKCCKNTEHVGKFGHAFDSVVGDNEKLFREFIVYENCLCYPEYLITYERR